MSIRWFLAAALLLVTPALWAQKRMAPYELPSDLLPYYEAGCDSTTGVWYPPLDRKEVYLNDSKIYTGDLDVVFRISPDLADRVCEWAACQFISHELAPNGELRTVLRNTCESRKSNSVVSVDSLASDVALMTAEVNKGIAESDKWNPSERKAAGRQMMLQDGPNSALYVLGVVRTGLAVPKILSFNERKKYLSARRALREILESHVKAAPQDIGWFDALTEFHLYTGNIIVARDMSRQLMRFPGATGYHRLLNGILERMNGDPAPLQAAFANCPPASDDFKFFYGDPTSTTEYCHYVVSGFIGRVEMSLGRNTPLPMREMILDLIGNSTVDAEWRIESLRYLYEIDHGRAAEAARQLADDPNADESIRQWGVRILGFTRDNEKSLEHQRQFGEEMLQSNRFSPRRIRQRDWDEIAAGRSIGGSGINYWVPISLLLDYYIETKNDEQTRANIEALVTVGASNDKVAEYLQRFTRSLVERGKTAEAERIIGYLSKLDVAQNTRIADYLRMELLKSSHPLRVEQRPWEPLTLDPLPPCAAAEPDKK